MRKVGMLGDKVRSGRMWDWWGVGDGREGRDGDKEDFFGDGGMANLISF